jgi:uncharacterized protein (TIGR02145 family)
MKNIRFLSFWLLLIVGMATVVFNSCSKDNDKKEISDDEISDDINGVVINGVRWAICNVAAPGTFAAKPEDPGMFYQWNRKTAWPATGDVTDLDATMPEGDAWAKANDPSPSGWRVPTREEIQSLLDTEKVTNEWTTQNGVNGRKFTDIASGNSLFLPAAGYRDRNDGTLGGAGSGGGYWSSTANGGDDAYGLGFSSDNARAGSNYRGDGVSVRAVAE